MFFWEMRQTNNVEIMLDGVLEELNRTMIHLSSVRCVTALLALLLALPLTVGFLFQNRNLVF